MTVCEMCGKAGQLVKADVEGVELHVCGGCSKYGKVRSQYQSRNVAGSNQSGSFRKYAAPVKEVAEFAIRGDFAFLLRREREKRKLTQEEFAKLLQEKESIVTSWEHGTIKPLVDSARRLEKVLGIPLVIKEDIEDVKMEKSGKKEELTLGDFIKVRKR
jgi:putative transcription factor